jgi:glycosyltransferase involved in cell wall biosynthesis
MKELDVIIPVYKSKSSIKALVDSLVAWKNKSDFSLKFIFVEDGGKDGTFEELVNVLGATSLNYSTYRLAQNYGQYTATAVGFNRSTADIVATIDDDLQHSPELIEKMFEEMEKNNSDLVYSIYPKKKHSAFRNFASWMMKRIMHLDGISYDETSSFRLINSSVISRYKNKITPVYFLEETLLRSSGKISSILVEHKDRFDGKSSYSNFKLFRMALKMILFHSSVPLRLITRFGVLISMIFFVVGIYFIYNKMINNVPLGFTSLIVAVFFSTGLIMFSLGIIGEYIRKIWIAQKRLDEVIVLTK